MKFTLKWLNEYVSTDGLTSSQLADKLTMLGLEVDAVNDMSQGLEGILTAKITGVRKHPDADRLTICDVQVGDNTVQVVCGAPNARVGMMTVIALPGVTLPGGMKIKQVKVRGQQSSGMLCAEDELGISDDHGGIIEIDEQVESGIELIKTLGLDDVMIEIDLTPNRSDCASVLGIAREVSGFTGNVFKKPVDKAELPVLSGVKNGFTVEIHDPALCPRYAARKLTSVTIGPSPRWLQQRLLAVGMRPINNIVDITNFVMLETGQPLHAFDFKKLAQEKIVVRRPSGTETKFTTLDDIERTLEPDMLMICDGEHPVAVAGIMGGLDSEVTDDTTEILLESACFNPVSIRKTARRLNLSSEASYRFERGVDPNGVDIAMQRAVNLMVALAGAEVEDGGVDEYPGRKDELVLQLRVQRVCNLLGMELNGQQIVDYLQSIEFDVASEEQGVLSVTVPSFRVDIEREVDLVEELARLVGYNDIPITLPQISMDYPLPDRMRSLCKDIASRMISRGFFEAINYSFVSENHMNILGLANNDDRRKFTRLVNPLTEDQSVMRTMLLPGLLDNVRHNLNHQKTDICLFEIGKVFFQHEDSVLPEEKIQLCAVMTGNRYPNAVPLYFSGNQTDIFDLKGIAQTLFETIGISGESGKITFTDVTDGDQPYCRNGYSILIMDGSAVLGMVGKVNAKTVKGFGIKQEVYFMEIDLTGLNKLPAKRKIFKSLPRYPSIKRDIAMLLPEAVAAGKLVQTIYSLNVDNVEHVEMFDVYRGKPIEAGMKSVALSVTYRSAEKTLDDETVDFFHNKIVNSLMSQFGGRYREGQE